MLFVIPGPFVLHAHCDVSKEAWGGGGGGGGFLGKAQGKVLNVAAWSPWGV